MLKTPKTDQNTPSLKSQIEALEQKNLALEQTIQSQYHAILNKLPFFKHGEDSEPANEATSSSHESHNDESSEHEMSFTASMAYYITKIIIKEIETFVVDRYNSYFNREDKDAS